MLFGTEEILYPQPIAKMCIFYTIARNFWLSFSLVKVFLKL